MYFIPFSIALVALSYVLSCWFSSFFWSSAFSLFHWRVPFHIRSFAWISWYLYLTVQFYVYRICEASLCRWIREILNFCSQYLKFNRYGFLVISPGLFSWEYTDNNVNGFEFLILLFYFWFIHLECFILKHFMGVLEFFDEE